MGQNLPLSITAPDGIACSGPGVANTLKYLKALNDRRESIAIQSSGGLWQRRGRECDPLAAQDNRRHVLRDTATGLVVTPQADVKVYSVILFGHFKSVH